MRPVVRTVLFFGLVFLVVSYSILLAYAFEAKNTNTKEYESKINSLLARRDDLITSNEQLKSKKVSLQSELVKSYKQGKIKLTRSELESAQVAQSVFLKQQQDLQKAQQAAAAAAKKVQTIQKVPVTTTKKVVRRVKRATTRAS